jgi:hypothetical protein
MNTLIKMKFGSHVYGCNTPTSDTDYKGVFIPDFKDIVLGKAPKTSVVKSTGDDHSRNTADDVDDEMFTLQGYLRMVAEGQVVALDMLFTPEEFWIEGDYAIWRYVRSFALKNLLSKNTTAYIGYCRKQAAKYGIKGSRVAEVRDLLTLLNGFDPNAKLYEYGEILQGFSKDKEHTQFVNNGNSWADILIECCQRKAPMTIKVKDAIQIYQKVFDAYGARALMAEQSEGVDWKAMHHAIRCCYEAIELLDFHKITFPLSEREYLLKVKKGEFEYKEVSEFLEQMMANVEKAKERSKLPEEPNWEALDNFVFGFYVDVGFKSLEKQIKDLNQ